MSKRLHDKLEDAVDSYEKGTGFDAINYRNLPKRASIKRKTAAIRQDLRWWELYAYETPRGLDRACGEVELEIEP